MRATSWWAKARNAPLDKRRGHIGHARRAALSRMHDVEPEALHLDPPTIEGRVSRRPYCLPFCALRVSHLRKGSDTCGNPHHLKFRSTRRRCLQE